jgi:hypothetical protein
MYVLKKSQAGCSPTIYFTSLGTRTVGIRPVLLDVSYLATESTTHYLGASVCVLGHIILPDLSQVSLI